MSEPPFDPLRALRTLLERDVRFVLIGGYAGALRGSPVITGDLDICYARDDDNLERLADALALARRSPPRCPAGRAVPARCSNAARRRSLHVQHVGGRARHPRHAVGDEGVRRPGRERERRGGRRAHGAGRVDRGSDPHEARGRPSRRISSRSNGWPPCGTRSRAATPGRTKSGRRGGAAGFSPSVRVLSVRTLTGAANQGASRPLGTHPTLCDPHATGRVNAILAPPPSPLLGPDRPAVPLDQALRDREAEPRAVAAAVSGGSARQNRSNIVRAAPRRDPLARVLHCHHDRAVHALARRRRSSPRAACGGRRSRAGSGAPARSSRARPRRRAARRRPGARARSARALASAANASTEDSTSGRPARRRSRTRCRPRRSARARTGRR